MATRKAGRPSTYSDELADRICEELSTSDTSLRQICARAGMPDLKTVMRWLASNEEFASKYAHARESQGTIVYDDMGALERRVLNRKVAPDAARVVLQSKQWRAAKLAPKKYGDRLQLHHAGGLTVSKYTLTDADLEAIAAGSSAGAAGTPPREGEP